MDKSRCTQFRAVGVGASLLVLTLVGLLTLSGDKLRGQETPSDEVRLGSRPYRPGLLRTESVGVELGVVVLDEKGSTVTGLKQEDFSV